MDEPVGDDKMQHQVFAVSPSQVAKFHAFPLPGCRGSSQSSCRGTALASTVQCSRLPLCVYDLGCRSIAHRRLASGHDLCPTAASSDYTVGTRLVGRQRLLQNRA